MCTLSQINNAVHTIMISTTRSLWTNNNKNQCWFLMFCAHTQTQIHTLQTMYKLLKCLSACVNTYSSGLLLMDHGVRYAFLKQFAFQSEVENQIHDTMDYMGLLTHPSISAIFIRKLPVKSDNIFNPFGSFEISNTKCCIIIDMHDGLNSQNNSFL